MSFLFLLACFILTNAGFTNWDYLVYSGAVLGQRTGVFRKEENPLGSVANSAQPYVKWHFDLALPLPVKAQKEATIEVAVLHHTMKREIGFYDSVVRGTDYCCNPDLYRQGQCSIPGRMLLRNSTFRTNNASNKFFYFSIPITATNNSTKPFSWEKSIPISQTGMWYFYLTNCEYTTSIANSVQLTGQIEWKNPYGYLPGQIATKLPIYWTLSVLYIILLITFGVFCCCYSENLMGLQYAIGVVIFICLIEQLIWSGGLVFYNFNGHSVLATEITGAFFTAVKMTAIRCLLLLVALGLSITKIRLGGWVIFAIVLLNISYFSFEFLYELNQVNLAAGRPVPRLQRALVNFGLFILNVAYFAWIVLATYITLTQLEEQKQEAKAKQFNKLGILLMVCLFVSGILLMAQGVTETMTYSDDYFKWWWSWDAYWQCVYFATVAAIFAIWRPSPNNKAYAYSAQIPQEDPGEDNLELPAPEDEVEANQPLESSSSSESGSDDKAVKLEEMDSSGSKTESDTGESSV